MWFASRLATLSGKKRDSPQMRRMLGISIEGRQERVRFDPGVRVRVRLDLSSAGHQPASMNPTRILCADWGKAANKRAVFVADAADRPIVRRLSHPGWTLSSLLQEANRLALDGPVMAALDVHLGVPFAYLTAFDREGKPDTCRSFLGLLQATIDAPRFFESDDPSEGLGGAPAVLRRAQGSGRTDVVSGGGRKGWRPTLLRLMDAQTGAKLAFVTAGIPGSVGSARVTSGCRCAPQAGASSVRRLAVRW